MIDSVKGSYVRAYAAAPSYLLRILQLSDMKGGV